ncbi:DUF2959 domain-containing protein [Desulfovibrio oxyclinae]|jgi:hypothetical protein|uniref:DUF2959 domain-containing protein n=1 Tax=Desulfovibrio oxyclinae TaxID=63560 RepID=UPI000367EBB3|nr:DUF2959 domain-containing protein [Desulfovibrio oxyclinae]
MRYAVRILLALTAVAVLAGCQKTYYSAMEQVGYHKREILVDRVGEAREANTEAKEQFATALDRFKSVVAVDGGELEQKYEVLNAEYEASEEAAEEVRDRIESVENVAEALFEEWRAELKQYTSAKLRRQSRSQYDATQSRYRELLAAMKRASSRMDPVLAAFKDQVLYLKHNLNAKAIASLEGELASIRADVDRLIKDMEKSIAEADAFIASMETK